MKLGNLTKHPLVLLLGLLFVWETLANYEVIGSLVVSSPSRLAIAAVNLVRSGVLFSNLFGSITRVLGGFCLAVALGVCSGVVLSLCTPFRSLASVIEILRPIPPIAWIPISIMWFGLGDRSAIFIVFLGAYFPIFVSTYDGVMSTNASLVNMARSLGAGRLLIVSDVLLPSALPRILVGLRTGLGVGWASVIAAEMIGSTGGLGYAIQMNRLMLQLDAVLVYMLAIGIAGWFMNSILLLIERQLVHWNHSTSIRSGSTRSGR